MMTKPAKTKQFMNGARIRGAMLLLTMWLILVLAVIAYSLSYELQLGLKMTSQGEKRVKARAIARAGVAKAVMDLKNDQLITAAGQGRASDTLEEVWARTDDKTDVDFGEGQYTVRIIDEQRKIDLNSLQPQNVSALAYLLHRACKVKEDDAQFIAEAIIDFRDPDLRPIQNIGMTEEEYYTDLGSKFFKRALPENWVFRPKNDALMNLEELLEVPGITRELLYGDPKETPIDPIDRLESKEESTALSDYVSVSYTGPLNINTCSLPVLESVMFAGTQNEGLAHDLAKRIDDLRKDRNVVGGVNTYGISNLGQLSQAGIEGRYLSQNMMLDVYSQNFLIISRGVYKGVRETMAFRVTVAPESYPLDPDNKNKRGVRDENASGKLKNRQLLKLDPAVRVTRTFEM